MSTSHLKKFTLAQIAKKAEQRAHDVPEYRQLLMKCQVRQEGKDAIIIDTNSPTWKKLLALCQAADERAKANGGTSIGSNVPTPTSTPTPTTAGNVNQPGTNGLARQASTPLPAPIVAPIPNARAQSGAPTIAPAVTTSTVVPLPASTPPPIISPVPVPPPAAPLAHSNSIERLFSKAASSLMRSKGDKPDVPTPAASAPVPVPIPASTAASESRRSETPDPGQYVTPSTSARGGSISLSSSPQVAPGSFLPPPSAVGLPPPSQPVAILPRSTRGSTSSASINPFISSLPPPMLPSASAAIPVPALAQNASTGTNSSLASSPAVSTTPSSSSASKFFKDFLNKVEKSISNEMNGVSSSSVAQTSSNAASTASSSSDPRDNEPNFLPVSGPFPQPVLSPMLSGASGLTAALTRTPPFGQKSVKPSSSQMAGAAGKSEVDEFSSALAPALSLSPALGAKKRSKKRASEIVQIVRAPAALLPTPFQSAAPAKSTSVPEEDGSLTDTTGAEGDNKELDSFQLDEQQRLQQEQDEEAEAEQARRIQSASPSGMRRLRKVKEGKTKKRSGMAKVDEPSPASSSVASANGSAAAHLSSSPPALSSSVPTLSSVSAGPAVSTTPGSATPGAASATASAPPPSHPLHPEASMDGIDLSDLVDDASELNGSLSHPEGSPVPHKDLLGEEGQEGEGQGSGGIALDDLVADEDELGEEGAAESNLPENLLNLPITLREKLAPFDASLAPVKESHPIDLASLLSTIHELYATSLVQTELSNHFASTIDALHPQPIYPDFQSTVHKAVAGFNTAASSNKPLKAPRRLTDASFHSMPESFIHAWVNSFERGLFSTAASSVTGDAPQAPAQSPDVLIAASASPSSVDSATIERAKGSLKSFLGILNNSDALQPLRTSLQQLLLLVFQTRLSARLHGAQATWTDEDILAFLRLYAPTLDRQAVLDECTRFRLGNVLEQLHSIFASVIAAPAPIGSPTAVSSPAASSSPTSSTPAPLTAKALATLEQRIVSANPDHVSQSWQLVSKGKDALLSHRFLPRCIRLLGTAAPSAHCFTACPTTQQALDHAAQNYPSIEPWLVARALDIKSSLFAGETQSWLSDREGWLDSSCTDLSLAPTQLMFHSSFLEVPSSKSPSAALGLVSLNLQQQQYHLYFHYLRTLLSIYEIVRQDAQIVLEYIRLCLCFGSRGISSLDVAASKDLLFRSWSERSLNPSFRLKQQDDPDEEEQAELVPARDSHLAPSWVHDQTILSLLAQPSVYSLSRDRLGRIFAKFGFFRGLVQVYIAEVESGILDDESRLEIIEQSFRIALCSDDALTFEQCVDAFILSQDTPLDQRVFLWKGILNQLFAMTVSPNAAAIAPRRLTLTVLLSHLIYSIGSQLAVSLLLSEPNYIDLCDRANLPASFYTDILEHAVLRCEQQTLAHTLVERIDSHLWSDRTRNLPENIRAIWNTEVSSASADDQRKRGSISSAQGTGVSTGMNGDSDSRPTSPSAVTRSLEGHPLSSFIVYRGDGSTDDGTSRSRSRPSASTNWLMRQKEYELTFDYPDARTGGTPNQRWYEDMSNQGHWGVAIDLDKHTCTECGMKMTDDLNSQARSSMMLPQLNSTVPITIFRCADVTHLQCAARTCKACARQ